MEGNDQGWGRPPQRRGVFMLAAVRSTAEATEDVQGAALLHFVCLPQKLRL